MSYLNKRVDFGQYGIPKRVDFGQYGDTTDINVYQQEKPAYLAQTCSMLEFNLTGLTEHTAGQYTGQYIACSADGRYVSICANFNLLVSNDYGATMTTTTVTNNLYSIIMNSTGQYQACISTGVIYSSVRVSSDYGVSWVDRFSNGFNLGRWFQSITMDPTGRYIYCGGGGQAGERTIYSTNYGVSWSSVGGIYARSSCCMNKLTVYALADSSIMNTNLLATTPTETFVTKPSLPSMFRMVTDGDLKYAYMSLTSNNFAYSLDGGLTFLSGVFPSTSLPLFLCFTKTHLWVLKLNQIFFTTDLMVWTESVQDEAGASIGGGIRQFYVSNDNSTLYVLYRNSTLYVKTLSVSSVIPTSSLLYINGLDSNAQNQINVLKTTTPTLSGTNILYGINTLNGDTICNSKLTVLGVSNTRQVADTILPVVFSATPTFSMTSGMIYNLTTNSTVLSSLGFTNIPITPQQTYTFTFILNPSTPNSPWWLKPPTNFISVTAVGGSTNTSVSLVGISNTELPVAYTHIFQSITIVNLSTSTTPSFIGFVSISGF